MEIRPLSLNNQVSRNDLCLVSLAQKPIAIRKQNHVFKISTWLECYSIFFYQNGLFGSGSLYHHFLRYYESKQPTPAKCSVFMCRMY